MTTNLKLYDGTTRCHDHMDASSYQGQTDEPCTYCPTDEAESCAWATAATCHATPHGSAGQCADHPINLTPGGHAAMLNRVATRTGVSLDKIPGQGHTSRHATEPAPRLPYYPLVGHRAGLRRNDLGTLASALWILANAGGTAHMSCEWALQAQAS